MTRSLTVEVRSVPSEHARRAASWCLHCMRARFGGGTVEHAGCKPGSIPHPTSGISHGARTQRCKCTHQHRVLLCEDVKLEGVTLAKMFRVDQVWL